MAVLVCFVTWGVLKEKGQRKILVALYLFSMPLLLDTAVSKGHIAGLPDAPVGTVQELALQRLAWPRLAYSSYYEYYDFLPEDFGLSVTTDSKVLWTDYFPVFDENVSRENKKIIYHELSKSIFSANKKAVIFEASGDFFDNAFAPFTPLANRLGKTGSRTGQNFYKFTDFPGARWAALLGSFYFNFGCISFLAVILLNSSCLLMAKKKNVKGRVVLCGAGIVLISLYNCYFTYRGFDYKNCGLIIILWFMSFYRADKGDDKPDTLGV